MTIVYNFFETNGYVFEMLIAVFFFCGWMDKRPRFFLRACLAGAALLTVSMLWTWIPFDNEWMQSIRTTLFFFLCVGAVKTCFEGPLRQAVFYVTAAGAAQHFSFRMARTLLAAANQYLNLQTGIGIIGYPALSVIFVLLCYLTFGRKLRKKNVKYMTGSQTVLFLLVGMQLCTNVFQNLFDKFSAGSGFQVYTIYSLFDMISCLFLLALQCEITHRESEQQNSEILQHILYQQKQQMEISKENIELINIKCHDIKNQIATLGNRVPQEEIRELERAVNIYDMAFKTGNEALDVLMVEKLMVCENKNIRLDCMMEGRLLSFMKQSDIYSLFGNAVDNAIEAVERLADDERRYIGVRVHSEKGMLVIHFENYYEGAIVFAQGLPQTTKEDKRYHGFGMKSIRMIVEKYQGHFSVKAQNGIFTLNILLPIST